MTARVLVVDDIVANVALLEAKLTAEYFDVLTATNGIDALKLAQNEKPDIILLDVMMPGMDGFEVCRRLKDNPLTMHIPVVMVTALDQPSDRIKGLSAGADDFLTKPIDAVSLFARVRSLVRIKLMIDELRLRQKTSASLGMNDPGLLKESEMTGRILVVEDKPSVAEKIVQAMPSRYTTRVEPSAEKAMEMLKLSPYDLAIISLNLKDFDGLRLCSALRATENLRHLSLLVLVEDGDQERLVRAFDFGVNDYLRRPLDVHEMLARVQTQLKRRAYAEQLRKNVTQSVQDAITDALTGLHNRRYLEMHFKNMIEAALRAGKPLSVCVLDIDKFKNINDSYGHDVGDEVLKEFAKRINAALRNIDMRARLGGEEFVVLMPETDLSHATMVAERLREAVGNYPFEVKTPTGELTVTVSIGLSLLQFADDTTEKLLKRADSALYKAKDSGRNRVVVCRKKPREEAGSKAAS